MSEIKERLGEAFESLDLERIKREIEVARLLGFNLWGKHQMLGEAMSEILDNAKNTRKVFKILDYVFDNSDVNKILRKSYWFKRYSMEYEFLPYKRNIKYLMGKGLKITSEIREALTQRIKSNIESIGEDQEYIKFMKNLLTKSEKEAIKNDMD